MIKTSLQPWAKSYVLIVLWQTLLSISSWICFVIGYYYKTFEVIELNTIVPIAKPVYAIEVMNPLVSIVILFLSIVDMISVLPKSNV